MVVAVGGGRVAAQAAADYKQEVELTTRGGEGPTIKEAVGVGVRCI